MLNEDQVQWGVRVRVLVDLPHAQVKAGTVEEITQVRRDSRPDSWGLLDRVVGIAESDENKLTPDP